MTENAIPVSEIVTAGICPMQAYLSKSQAYEEPLSYSVAKQISYHLGGTLDVEEIWDELELTVPNCGSDARDILEKTVAGCKKMVWRQALDYDVTVQSEKYNIFGRIDRLFDDGFSIVKAGNAPLRGVYSANRLQAACYTICLEEMKHKEIYGCVEYLGSASVRSVILSPSDKRAFLSALKEAEKIENGIVPSTRRGAACRNCRFTAVCSAAEKPKTLFQRLTKGT